MRANISADDPGPIVTTILMGFVGKAKATFINSTNSAQNTALREKNM
jgi:hypothetical protein